MTPPLAGQGERRRFSTGSLVAVRDVPLGVQVFSYCGTLEPDRKPHPPPVKGTGEEHRFCGLVEAESAYPCFAEDR